MRRRARRAAIYGPFGVRARPLGRSRIKLSREPSVTPATIETNRWLTTAPVAAVFEPLQHARHPWSSTGADYTLAVPVCPASAVQSRKESCRSERRIDAAARSRRCEYLAELQGLPGGDRRRRSVAELQKLQAGMLGALTEPPGGFIARPTRQPSVIRVAAS